MKTNIIGISPPTPHLAKFWFWSYGPKCCQSIKLQNSLKCNISRKKWTMNFIYGMDRLFCSLILSFWVSVVRHAQSTQNNNFTCIYSYLLKNLGDEVVFLPADKQEVFLQVDSINLGVRSQACPKYPK